jgi:hypothetical protein
MAMASPERKVQDTGIRAPNSGEAGSFARTMRDRYQIAYPADPVRFRAKHGSSLHDHDYKLLAQGLKPEPKTSKRTRPRALAQV